MDHLNPNILDALVEFWKSLQTKEKGDGTQVHQLGRKQFYCTIVLVKISPFDQKTIKKLKVCKTVSLPEKEKYFQSAVMKQSAVVDRNNFPGPQNSRL